MSEDYLASLNGPQKEAVLDCDHTLLVLAGAGSGKTRVITAKIVYAIKTLGLRPWQILAVTFTNKAANEMRSRVESMLGPEYDISSLEIKTFHAYGASLLHKYGSAIGLVSGFSIYDDADSQALLQNLYPDENRNTLKECARIISRVKDRGYTPESREISHYDNQVANFRIRFREYERSMRANQCVDFADLILRSNELLEENPDIREHLHNRYRLILVDEYQDSNGSQFRLLRNLAGEHTQLVVVGDDDQSIYRFRGAEIENILNFNKIYPDTRVIKLEENYRSTKSIIRLAGDVIRRNKGRHEKTLFTNNEEGSKPVVHTYLDAAGCNNKIRFELGLPFNADDRGDEEKKIAEIISQDLGKMDTAILFRTNAQSSAFEFALSDKGIKCQVVGTLKFYEREEVKDVLALFRLFVNPRDVISFSRVINKPVRGIGKASIQKILSVSSHVIDAMDEILKGDSLSSKAKSGVIQFMNAYKYSKKNLEECGSLAEFGEEVVKSFGIYDLYNSESDINIRESKLGNIGILINEIGKYEASYAGLSSFLDSITLDSSSLPGEDNRISSDKNVIKLITMHNTKGLEFDRVFVTGLEDSIIPGNRSGQSDKDIEEERRIFYVAITRARKELYLSWAQSRKMWGRFEYQEPSRFLRAVNEDLYTGSLETPKTVRTSPSSYVNRYSYTPRYSNMFRAASSEGNTSSVFAEPRTKPVERVKNDTVFSLDDRVHSPDYGDGTVVSCERKNEKTIIRVSYDNGRKAVYNTAFCNLKKI